MSVNSNIEKCLFNSNDDVVDEIIKSISTAKNEIYVMHFWFSWKPIADALINAHKRGVKVNVLTDQRSLVKFMQDDEKTYSLSVPEYLFENGIKRVAIYFNHILHHKVIIIDNILLNGSLNLFKKSIYEDIESIIFINNENICKFYKKEFESIFINSLALNLAMEAIKDKLRD